jgi:pyruvate ferredoxin oxidoreductase beta subunit
LAVETGVFPLYEVEKGRYRLSMDFPKLRPIKEYFKPQGRFRHLTDSMIEEIEKQIHQDYQELKARAGQAG